MPSCILDKNSRTRIANEFVTAMHQEIEDSEHGCCNNTQQVVDLMPAFDQDDGVRIHPSDYMMALHFDKNGKTSGVEVRDDEGRLLFIESIDATTEKTVTMIVTVDEGKGTKRKFEVTAPTGMF
jgi:hypothetical protein